MSHKPTGDNSWLIRPVAHRGNPMSSLCYDVWHLETNEHFADINWTVQECAYFIPVKPAQLAVNCQVQYNTKGYTAWISVWGCVDCTQSKLLSTEDCNLCNSDMNVLQLDLWHCTHLFLLHLSSSDFRLNVIFTMYDFASIRLFTTLHIIAIAGSV